MTSIKTDSLTKLYGESKAVDNLNIIVDDGEIFGFLGTNGAGKSTTMMILTTLLKPTSGTATVTGFDVVEHPKQVRRNIGYVQQDTSTDEFLSGRDNLVLQSRLAHIPKADRASRIEEMLQMLELSERADDSAVKYSGGMRKRLDIGGGLLHRPRVLFLDEPTVGLDIQTRQKIWEYIRHIHDEYGMTIFLSTHYMEEADQLCDRIGIIDNGHLKTVDSPASLKSRLENEVITIDLADVHIDRLALAVKNLDCVQKIDSAPGRLLVYANEGNLIIPQIFQESHNLGITIDSISIKRPTLDDVFISYTGHKIQDNERPLDRKKAYRRTRELRL